MNLELQSFLQHSRQASDIDKLFSLYQQLLNGYGLDRLAYAVVSDHPQLRGDNDLGLVGMTDDLHGWAEHYRQNEYFGIDISAQLCIASPGLFEWNKVRARPEISPQQRAIFDEANDAGLHRGLTVSVHGSYGTKGSALMASSDKALVLNRESQDLIYLASQQFHLCFLSLINFTPKRPIVSLSPKEQEILKWMAQGLTKAQISERLNLSVHTIDYHNRNVLRKLDVNNTAAALVAAIKHGAIVV